jgi:hypothetical protein
VRRPVALADHWLPVVPDGRSAAGRLPSFTSPDRRYRVCACDGCRRYLKAYNAQGATRPVLPEVDLIATLPLDAAAAQRGYSGG